MSTPTDRLADAIERLAKAIESRELPVIPTMPPVMAPYSRPRGCQVCGVGANGEAMGYVCPRTDCPSQVRWSMTTSGGVL